MGGVLQPLTHGALQCVPPPEDYFALLLCIGDHMQTALDDSDTEAVDESDGETGFDLSALFKQAAEAPLAGQPGTAQVAEVPRRRITGKRAVDGTDLPARALVNKAEDTHPP